MWWKVCISGFVVLPTIIIQIHLHMCLHTAVIELWGKDYILCNIFRVVDKTDDAAIKGDWSWHTGDNQQRRNVEASGCEADTVLCWWINDELWAVLLARPAELVNSACHCTVRDLFQITRLSVLSMRQERLQFFWRFFFENLFSFLINYHAWGGFLSLINLRLLCIQKIKSTWMGYRHWWELWCKVLHLKIGSL